MSLGNCIPGLVAAGKLSKKQGEEAGQSYERHYRRLSQTMGPATAAAEASEAAVRELEFAAKTKKRQAFLQVDAQRRAMTDAATYRGESPYAAIRAMMGRDIRAPYANIEGSAERIQFQAMAGLYDFLQRHRRNLLGRMRNKAGMLDVVAELHGGDAGNPVAKQFASAVADTFESLRRRFNEAGGTIAKLEGWGLPHGHDALKVRRTPYAQWREDILAGIAPERMVDPETGGAFTAETLEQALRGAYDSIRTNGLNAEPGGGFGGKLANRRSDHRFFVFKDGPAWLDYHAKYGTGDPFSIITGHIRGMSHDIATMERLGPNPETTVRWLLDNADRHVAQSDAAAVGQVTGTSGGRRSVEKLWSFMKGELSAPVFAEGKWTEPLSRAGVKALAGTRDILASALLGSAPITAISDLSTQKLARRFNGLPQTILLKRYIEQLVSAKQNKAAVRLGLGARDATRTMMGLSRYFGETNGPEITSIIADDVLRASGLNKMTEAGQRLFGMDMLRELGGSRGKAFADLPPTRRAAMERYGIDAGAWDAIRKGSTYQMDGAHYLDWKGISDPKASDRLMDWVLGETAAAVQEASARARASLVTDRPGTFWGEFGRNVVQFKSFGIALVMNQAERLAMLPAGQRLAYGAEFMIGITLLGALELQLREVAKGRDPRPMDSAEFWLDAMVQGGGLGIFGDLFGTFKNDRLKSTAEFAAGPAGSLVGDLKDTYGADVKHAIEGRPTKGGAHTIHMLQRYTPGGNLWYARAAFQRELLDRLSQHIDPDYRSSWNRMEEQARAQGQGYAWRPGDMAPSRVPDYTKALAAPPPAYH